MDEATQAKPAGPCVHYQRRRPEQTTLYQLVQEHAETFFAQVERDHDSVLEIAVCAGPPTRGCTRARGRTPGCGKNDAIYDPPPLGAIRIGMQ